MKKIILLFVYINSYALFTSQEDIADEHQEQSTSSAALNPLSVDFYKNNFDTAPRPQAVSPQFKNLNLPPEEPERQSPLQQLEQYLSQKAKDSLYNPTIIRTSLETCKIPAYEACTTKNSDYIYSFKQTSKALGPSSRV